MKNWAILFVKVGAEQKVTRTLREILSADKYLPFLPVKEVHRSGKNCDSKKRKLMFPGYVFIQTEIEADGIAADLRPILKDDCRIREVYSILHYGDDVLDVAVRVRERTYWERLFDAEFCVTGSVGIIEGDKITVISGPLVGMEGSIRKINRHKREAVVELDMMGAARVVKLMLEIVAKHTSAKT